MARVIFSRLPTFCATHKEQHVQNFHPNRRSSGIIGDSWMPFLRVKVAGGQENPLKFVHPPSPQQKKKRKCQWSYLASG